MASNCLSALEDSTASPLPKRKEESVKKVLGNLFKRSWDKNEGKLRILVTGRTGQGKSSLINGILGEEVAREGAGAKRCTTAVEKFKKTVEGVPIKIYDSPGLQDRTADKHKYILNMREMCKELSLVLYCTKMTNPRLTEDDKSAIVMLTHAFGENFWDYAVFVLTFANHENVERHDERDKDGVEDEPDFDDEEAWNELKKERFKGRLKFWEDELHNFLIKEGHIDSNIANNVPVVPTGDKVPSRYNKQPLRLYDRDDWFVSFWEVCCLRVKDTHLFLKINSNRMVPTDDMERFRSSSFLDDDEDIQSVNSDDEDFESTIKNILEDTQTEHGQVDDGSGQNIVEEVKEKMKQKVIKFEFKDDKATETSSTPTVPIPIEGETPSIIPKVTRKDDGPKFISRTPQASPLKPIELQQAIGQQKSRRKKVELTQHNIPISRTLVRDVAAQEVRKAGHDKETVQATRVAVDQMKLPSSWFMKLLRTRSAGWTKLT